MTTAERKVRAALGAFLVSMGFAVITHSVPEGAGVVIGVIVLSAGLTLMAFAVIRD